MTIRTDLEEYTVDSANRRVVQFPRGAAKSWRHDIEDSAGDPQNMTGWSLGFAIYTTSDVARVSKATGGSGITIGNGSGTNDRATVTLTHADTRDLKSGLYQWALWRTDAGFENVLGFGTLVLSDAPPIPD